MLWLLRVVATAPVPPDSVWVASIPDAGLGRLK